MLLLLRGNRVLCLFYSLYASEEYRLYPTLQLCNGATSTGASITGTSTPPCPATLQRGYIDWRLDHARPYIFLSPDAPLFSALLKSGPP